MTSRAHRFKPPVPLSLGGYDFDAFVVASGDALHLDFRFELGRGLGIFWALPAGRNDRLRLLHVDGAAYTVDEPVLMQDPWVCELPRLEWLAQHISIEGGGRLVAVAIEMHAQPPSYQCDFVTETTSGRLERICLGWKGV